MGLVEFMVVMVVLGLVWYMITTYVPMAAPMKTVITVVAVLFLCIMLLQMFGITDFQFARGWRRGDVPNVQIR